ncbi:MAG: hypothetical protein J7M27_05635, partial [Candidatus Latescibacteria bacterium]|nr:hypothetical protein [Candidatus Latescibacterota bacterium]
MPEKTKFFFFAFILVLAATALVSMGWDRSGSAEKFQEGAKYVGAAGCRCHQQERLGGQVPRWTGTPHARSYLVLGTGCPEMIEAEAKGMVEVGHG